MHNKYIRIFLSLNTMQQMRTVCGSTPTAVRFPQACLFDVLPLPDKYLSCSCLLRALLRLLYIYIFYY